MTSEHAGKLLGHRAVAACRSGLLTDAGHVPVRVGFGHGGEPQ
jgi:hypothetical protein